MIELHPQIVTKDGEKQFVILPYDEFAAIQEALADADDLNALRIAKNEESKAPTVPLEEVIATLGLTVEN
jgi:PHD/YefM family antitoxin component YafN of YafNO toxin-antitoxin module